MYSVQSFIYGSLTLGATVFYMKCGWSGCCDRSYTSILNFTVYIYYTLSKNKVTKNEKRT